MRKPAGQTDAILEAELLDLLAKRLLEPARAGDLAGAIGQARHRLDEVAKSFLLDEPPGREHPHRRMALARRSELVSREVEAVPDQCEPVVEPVGNL